MTFPTFTWPNWRKEAKPGERFRDTRSGRTGTFVKPHPVSGGGAIVIWDVPSDRPAFKGEGEPSTFVGFATWAVPIEES